MDAIVGEVSRIHGIIIRQSYGDHAPPHFHAHCSSGEAQIEIATGRLLHGSLPPKVRRLVLKWIALHRDELDWRRARRRKAPKKIAPL